MKLSKDEILKLIKDWLIFWDEHNLEGVMELMNEDVVFENWTGEIISGKSNLQRSWVSWFINHGNFKFTQNDIFVDEHEQKVLFSWTLNWPSMEKAFKGKSELRRGVDVLHFKDGKISNKYSYSKTMIHICSKQVSLSATSQNK
jgi:ketosteroid isomerase-like protein